MRARVYFQAGLLAVVVAIGSGGLLRHAHAAIEDAPNAIKPAAPVKQPVLSRAPELVEFFNADYPPELLAQQLGGEATLDIDIGSDGAVERVEVASASQPAFGAAALMAACHFVFRPAEIDNAPGAVRIAYRYQFVPQIQPTAVPPPSAPAPVLFSGLVREAGNRAPIPYASLYINDEAVGSTDATGAFSLRDVPEGALRVHIAHPDYSAYDVLVQREAHQRLEAKYYLIRRNRNAYETVVRTQADRTEVTKIELSRQELQKVPGTFGDPIRVIENLPGMGRAPVLGGQLLVRGANPADTQVLVDGMPIPILYHFFGLTSVINAEFLDRIDFFPGGFGARYGRATAGVVDIITRDLDCDLWHGTAKADVIDAAAFTCVPLGTWRLSGSARRSYIDSLLPWVIDRLPRQPDEGVLSVSPVYWDYQARGRGAFPGHIVDVSAFGSSDNLKVIQTGALASINVDLGLVQGFHRLIVRDRWRISDRLRLTSSVSPAYQWQNFASQSTDVGVSTRLDTGIYSIDWREDFALDILPQLKLTAGLDHLFGYADVNLNAPIPTTLETFPTPTFDFTHVQSYESKPRQITQGYWVELVWDPMANLRLVPGLRLDDFHFGSVNHFLPLPRAAVRWELIPGSTAKAAWGMYARLPDPQYLLPSIGNASLKPERSQQFVVGWEQSFAELINLDVQLYYNVRSDLVVSSRNVTIVNGAATPQLYDNTGSGDTYGLEVLLRRLPASDNMFYGWIAYTLSRSERRDHARGATYFNGMQTLPYPSYATELYLSTYDQTHILTIIGQWVLPYGFEAGFRFRLVSGNPTTPVRSGHIYYDADSDAYGNDLNGVQRNSDRLPAFHQLDVRLDKTFIFPLWKLTVYLELINAYYAKNVEAFQYDYRYRNRVAVTLLPIIPNLGVKGEF